MTSNNRWWIGYLILMASPLIMVLAVCLESPLGVAVSWAVLCAAHSMQTYGPWFKHCATTPWTNFLLMALIGGVLWWFVSTLLGLFFAGIMFGIVLLCYAVLACVFGPEVDEGRLTSQ